MREGPKSVILANLKARRSYLTEEMTPFGVVLAPQGVIQTPDPLLGCGLLAISSVILAPRGPGGVIQGPKRGQNGSFWGSQNDPSDRWFWPFSPPKPGQEGSKKGSKKGSKPPLLDPLGPLWEGHFRVITCSKWDLALGGVQNDPFGPLWDPSQGGPGAV